MESPAIAVICHSLFRARLHGLLSDKHEEARNSRIGFGPALPSRPLICILHFSRLTPELPRAMPGPRVCPTGARLKFP